MKTTPKNTSAIWKRMIVSFLLLALIVPGLYTGSAHAAPTDESVRMNVVLVIDGSGSLTTKNGTATDPQGLRYDAIDLFLALLTNDGNNVSVIVFNEGFDTFRLSTDPVELQGKSDKLALSEQIRKAGTGGDTNIGAALLKGVNDASTMNQQNGLESVVILFSDGRTDLGKDAEEAEKESLADKEEAIVAAQDADIPVYTICLKANSIADPDEMEEIAIRTGGQPVTVDEAADLTKAFESFYSLIFASASSEIQETQYPDSGVLTFTIPIPAYGAEEVNIILDTNQLTSKKLYSPSGQLTEAQVADFTMSGGYYDVIKLVDPECGDWTVELTGIPKRDVTINVLYNIDSSAQIATADGRSDYKSGEDVTFQVNLIQNGDPVKDQSITDEYSAKLLLTNMADGTVEEVEMANDGSGTFTHTMKAVAYTSYQAEAILSYNDLTLQSQLIAVNFDNTSPVASQDEVVVEKTVTQFSEKTHTMDMSAYFSDAQDSQLTYSILSSQLVKGTADLDPKTGELVVDISQSRSGKVVIQAADSQGAVAQMTVHFKITDMSGVITGSFIVILLIILGVLILVAVSAWIATHKPWRGMLTVTNLTNNIRKSHGDFRGTLKLKSLNLGNCGLDGAFKSTGHNRIEFVSKRPVFLQTGTAGKDGKHVLLNSGTITIYADQSMTTGIEVDVTSNFRSGGFSGFGGMGGMGSPKPKKRSSTPTTGSNPFQ